MGNYSAEEKAGRDAWRSMLVPAVGSIAFFATLVVNVIRNYKKHGWPSNAFKRSDYILMAIPFAVIGLAVFEEVENGDTEGAEGVMVDG